MARIAYTERFRSSLMALISIFLRPMVCEYGQTGGHGRVIRGVGGGRWVWLESAEDKGKCSRAATGKKERRDDRFQAGARPVDDDELEAAGSGLRDICLRGCATLLTGGPDAQREALGSDAEG